MNNTLGSQDLVPTTEPYSDLGFTHVNGGGETVDASVFDATGDDAIVDWLFLELRDKTTPSTVVLTRCALLQSDGDIVPEVFVANMFTQANLEILEAFKGRPSLVQKFEKAEKSHKGRQTLACQGRQSCVSGGGDCVTTTSLLAAAPLVT